MKRIFSLILALMAVQMMWGQGSEFPEIDLTSDNFYVKENGEGNGSSWKNAMGPKTFAYYLPQVKDGTTFHVAAGTYYPMYNSNLNLTTESDALYTINSNVTIKGGYPAEPSEGTISDPSKYKATFSGDLDENDKINFYKGDSLVFKNFDNNLSVLFVFASHTKDLSIKFEGVSFSHSLNAVLSTCYNGYYLDLYFDYVEFEANLNGGIDIHYTGDDNTNLFINHSLFKYNATGIHGERVSLLEIKNTKFEDNIIPIYIFDTSNECYGVMDSISVIGNLRGSQLPMNLTISNSSFESNGSSFVSTGSSLLYYYSSLPCALNILNSNFVGNKGFGRLFNNNDGVATIKNCSFISNETAFPITWVKDLTVNHSYVYDHIGNEIFHAEDNLSLNSDTIESCKLESYMIQSGNCRIDSCLIKNNDSYLFFQSGNFELRNSEIIENFKTDMNSEIPIISLNSKSEDDRVNVVNTIFEDNKYKDCVFLKNEGTFSFNFDHCLSDSNESSQYFDLSNPKSNILNSTFDNCVVTNGSLININGGASLRSENSSYVNNTSKIDILHKVNDDILNNLGDSLILRNNTIAKNTSGNIIYDNSSVYSAYINNTIVGNMVSSPGLPIKRDAYCDSFDFVGNIILGNGSDVYEKNTSNYVYPDGLSVVLQLSDKTANITYNLSTILRSTPYSPSTTDYSTWKPSNNTNLLIKPYLLDNESGCIICPYSLEELESNVLSDIFKGSYNSKSHLFTPVLEYKNGFTPTVALKSDKLSDGKSIRFPRLDDVLTDQRGVSRLDMTCMGAYEIGCGNDTTITTDTINVGTKIFGQTFTEVGVHDGIIETLQNVNGCDSVVLHKVVVRPTAMNYYVKTKKVNKGDGSNWENAMDEKGFLTYLPLAPEGATFHVAAGEYLRKSDKLKSISVKNDVTIIGGYPADATKGAVSDPKKYSTHISLFRELTSGNDAVKVELYNLKFSDFSIVMNNYADFTLVVDKCKFQGYGTGSNVIYSGNKSVIKLTDSYFSGENNPTTLIAGMYGGTVDISGCTFAYYRKSDSYLIDISYPTHISLINSTIVYNVLNGVIGGATTHTNKLLNNTIVGNKFGNEFFHMTKQPPVFEGNIYAENGYEFVSTFSNTNIYNKKVSDILEGTVDETSGLFSPELKDNGGFTPTVALKSDKLPDDKSIRFPRLDDVLTDQRGVSRLPETCMGAYEIGCGSDTTFTTDTINVGTKIFGQTFTEVGVHDSIFETLQTAIGCDSVVMHKVVVKPTSLNYYVKTERKNKGDGSDWDNAMNGEDFAKYLPLAPDGATFYVAAGTYKPIYDANLNVPDDSYDLCYTIKNNVTIRGGYSDKATGTNVVNEPDKYQTIFDGDIEGNDVIDETLDEDGYPNLKRSKGEENVKCLFNVGFIGGQTNAKNVTLDGVVCQNAVQYVLCSYNSTSLDLVNVVLDKNSGINAIYQFEDVNIRNSLMSQNFVNNEFLLSSGKNINIINTTFESNICSGSSSFIGIPENNVYVKLDSIHYLNNKIPRIVEGSGNEIEISNSHFSGNYSNSAAYFNYLKQIDSRNNVFEKNITAYGIYNIYGNIILRNDSFYSNSLEYIANSSYGDVYVYNSSFGENQFGITSNGNNGIIGGENIFVADSKFDDNKRNNKNTVDFKDDSDDIAMFAKGRCVAIRDTVTNNDLSVIFRSHLLKIDSCNVKDNHSQIASYFYVSDNEVCDSITNSVFMGNRTTFSGGRDSSLFYLKGYQDNIKSIFFYNNIVTANSGNGLLNLGSRKVQIENNTVAENNTSSLLKVETIDFVLKNNTLVSNSSDPIISCSELNKQSNSLYAYNNTIVGNGVDNQYVLSGKVDKSVFVGNIFTYPFMSDYKNAEIINNALLNTTGVDVPAELKSTNVFDDDLTILFNGTYDLTTGVFIPELKDNGGFTPTVALKSDKLSDGRSIRFPRLENVLTDQRGVERLDSTCMGAYEMNCRPVETELKDTVFVGDSYTFNGKNLDETCQKVGSYHFIETLTSAAGCDSVVKLSLAVRPLKNVSDYYVKTDGKGDGSDWINAMSPKDFAAHLPLVGDGVTFHIANGTYRSTYVDPELGVMYNINSSVRLIGSYPDTVKTVGVPPMPDVFTTTLTANPSGKDYIYIYKNRPGDYSVNGFRDNDSILIRVNGSPTVSLYGITLSGVKSENYGAVTMNDGGTLNLDRCAILKNNASGVVASNVKVNVSATLAYQNVAKDGAVFRLNNSDLNVTQSAFHENISAGENVKAKGAVANLVESRATFVNSTIANNWADMGGAFALSKSEISLANNTFVGNLSINNEGEIGSVLYSDIVSKVTLFGNMIAGNGSSPIYAPTFKSEGYNIFSTDLKSSGAPTDMFMSSKDYPYIIDGDVMPGNADIFIATVGDNGGFTPTVAMIESTFDGGEVISIPLDQRKVKVDQRDMLRKEKSCVGAYEYPTYKNYYVKQSPIGDGTGRDWENAMGDTTFFQYFSAVPAGATFHVAAGIYHPLDDRHNQSKSYSYRRYSSCRPLSVYGGYPPKAELNAVADPSQYVTLLSADFKGDDVFEESTNDYSVMEYFNYKDNSSYLMSIISKVPGVVQLKGVTFSGNYTQFRGVSSALEVSSVSPEISISLKMDSCSFKKTDMGIYSDADTLIARGCCFDSIYYLGMSYYPREAVPCVLEIENSSFTNLNEAFYMYASNGKVLLQNSTFCNAKSLVEINAHSYTKETVDLTLEMYHNTFAFSPKSYVGVRIPNYIHTIAKGNIFNTDFSLLNDPDEKNTIKPVVSDYNLFVDVPDATKKVWTLGENDILVAPSDLKGVLSGTMKDDRFHAASIMKSPENFTKVVALESDVVDHKYIRMPVTEGRVRVDQIATERLDMTCMGAYEMRCDLLDLETVEIDTTKSTNDIVRDDQTKKYDNTCINGDLKVVFYIAGGCGTNLNGYANVVYKYSDSDEQYVSDTIYPQKQANVDIYETTIPYRESSSYIKYRIEVSGMKNGNSKMSSPTSNGFWNVNSCDSMHSIINDPVFALCKEVGNTMSVFVKLGGDTVENGKLTLHYSENVLEESPSEFKNAEFVSPDGENYYAENIELAEETKFFNYYITYGHGDDIRNSLGNGEDDVIRVSVDEIDSICVDPCNNIRLSSHVLVEKDDTLSFDIYRKNTKVELFLCDENGVKLAGKEYYNLPIENKKFNLITELSLRSKDLDLSYVRPYLLALKIDGKVSCMYVYLGRKPRVKPTEK